MLWPSRRRLWLLGSYSLLVLAIVAPWWLRSGYVWLLDSVWGPHLAIDWAHPTTNLGWQIITWLLSHGIGSAAAEKLVLSGILLAIPLAGYRLGRQLLSPAWAWAVGVLYLLNPFVYERLLAGQWIVLAGYAWLPLLLALASDWLDSAGRRSRWRLVAGIALAPLVSPHFAYIGFALLVVLAAVYAVLQRPQWLLRRRTLVWLAAVGAATVLVNAPWIFNARQAAPAFTTADFATFQTAPDDRFGTWANVLGLYGFWRGSAFIEPKDHLGSLWLALAAGIGLAAIAGAVWALRWRRALGLTLALSFVPTVVLAVGYATPVTQAFTNELLHHLPGYQGLRETGKLIGVLALVYAVLAPAGASWLWHRVAAPRRLVPLGPAALAVVAALTVTGLWWGASGQVTVAPYPAGWKTVNQILDRQPHPLAAVLPWHGYLRLDFANGTYAANPAPVFFARPVITGTGFDNADHEPTPIGIDATMVQLLSGSLSPQAWANGLRARGTTHIILLKTDDWPAYNEILDRGNFPVEYSDESIALYRLY